MNTERHNFIKTPFDTRTPERLCCYCGKPRPVGRRRWCSDACVQDFQVRKGHATVIRALLHKRDNQICARCGWDSKPLARVLYWLSWRARTWLCAELGIGSRVTLWDADHIVPVVEGGGGCGLDNYRTLCIWCHREVTAELAASRATRRRDSNRPLLALVDNQLISNTPGGKAEIKSATTQVDRGF